eukprot:1977111-Pyramimonas_sp.AAC.1
MALGAAILPLWPRVEFFLGWSGFPLPLLLPYLGCSTYGSSSAMFGDAECAFMAHCRSPSLSL